MFLSGNQLALGRLVRLKDELHGFRYNLKIKTKNLFINLKVNMKLLRITAEGLLLFKEKLDFSLYV